MYRLFKMTSMALGLICCLGGCVRENPDDSGIPVFFLPQESARHFLNDPDDEFIKNLGPFDRSARMKTDRDVSTDQFLSFVADQSLDWTPRETDRIKKIFSSLSAKIKPLNIRLPDPVYLIKTTGEEEGQKPYCRKDAIVLPSGWLTKPEPLLEDTIAHELFHLYSKHHEKMREKMYAIIGFQKCEGLPFPPAWAERRITNPDALTQDYCLKLEQRFFLPLLFSRTPRYDPAHGTSFFDFLTLAFFEIRQINGRWDYVRENGSPVLRTAGELPGLFDQIGRNTGYIIHPEEILADNFSLLLSPDSARIKSPWILEKMRKILTQQ